MKLHSLAIAVALVIGANSAVADTNTFEIEDDNIERLTVVSSRVVMPIREIATSVSIVTKEDIDARGYSNLSDVLKTQPSINATNSGGLGSTSALRIRGEEGFRTQIRIDGVEVSDPTGVQIGPQVGQIQSANISRVEILRGSQGLAYGADAGGVINVQSGGYDEKIGGSLSGEFGRFDTRNFVGDIGGKSDGFDYYIAASSFDTDGFNSRVDDETQDDDGYENNTVHLRLGFTLTDNFYIGLVARNTNAETEFDNCGFGATATNNCDSTFNQGNVRLNAVYTTNKSAHELAYSKTLIEREFFTESVSSFLTEGTLERVEYLGNTQINENHNLVYGIDWKDERITTDNVSRNNRGYHIEYQAQLIDNLYFTAGARIDDNDDFGTHTSYRLSSAYIPVGRDEIKFRGAYGTGFRAPSLSELAFNRGPFAFAPAAGTDLSEETTEGYELAVGYTSKNNSSIELVYFDQEIEDSIFFDLATFSGYLQDEGITDSDGIEIIGNLEVSKNLSFTGNFTYNDTTQTDGSQRLRRPERLANIGANYNTDKFTVSANVRHVGGFVDIGNVELDDYTIVDISARYYVDEHMEIFARIENLLDEDYQDLSAFNTSGAAPHVGIKYQF